MTEEQAKKLESKGVQVRRTKIEPVDIDEAITDLVIITTSLKSTNEEMKQVNKHQKIIMLKEMIKCYTGLIKILEGIVYNLTGHKHSELEANMLECVTPEEKEELLKHLK